MVLGFVAGTVLATVATAGAASLITGRQIKDGTVEARDLSPAVRAQLKRVGTSGPQGPAGRDGAQGPAGTFPATLPPGRTLRGALYTNGNTAQTFAFALASPPAVHYVPAGTAPSAACPGTNADPQAAGGHLCVYATNTPPVTPCIFAPDDIMSSCTSATRNGFGVGLTSGQLYGQWAVTAP